MNNWKSIVRNIAPTLGAALGGPAAGAAVKYLAQELLGPESNNATESEVARFIETSATPEQLLGLKRLDNEFAAKMRELDIDVFELEVRDRQNAREMFRIAIWPQIVLSALFIIGYFLVLAVIVVHHDINISERMLGILNTVLGVLTAAIPMILQFWFGSSTGSKEKSHDHRLRELGR